MSNKPTLLLLASYHMSNPGLDQVDFSAEDVLSTKRQGEIADLVSSLKRYFPTRIAVECNIDDDSKLQERYSKYLNDELELDRNESEQIGFRLGKQLGHEKIHAVDWNHQPSVDPDKLDFISFAEKNNQIDRLSGILDTPKKSTEDLGRIQETGSILDMFKYINSEETLNRLHRSHMEIVQIGLGEHYAGAEWLQYWYGRNLKILANLTRIAESDDDRIMLIIGASHIKVIGQLAADSGLFCLEDIRDYLK